MLKNYCPLQYSQVTPPSAFSSLIKNNIFTVYLSNLNYIFPQQLLGNHATMNAAVIVSGNASRLRLNKKYKSATIV